MNKIFSVSPVVRENLNVAIISVKGNKLRSLLTIFIIAVGITSLVGILTATDALKNEVYSSFEKMGTSSFTISSRNYTVEGNTKGRVRNSRALTYRQAIAFKEKFNEGATVSVYSRLQSGATAKYGGASTNPTSSLFAADENYLKFRNVGIASGRGLSANDMEMASFVCVVGNGIAGQLFGERENPVGKIISVQGVKYEIVGVKESEGVSFGGNADNDIIVPISSARSYFMGENTSFSVGVVPHQMPLSEDMMAQAEQIMRSVRRLSPIDGTDFRIVSSKAMIEQLREVMGGITAISAVIGLVTLLGAAVGLMNIMLVSVKERTREIGTRKALGASSEMIKVQFLFESVVISQIGCLAGTVMGIVTGNAVAFLMGAPFVFPWHWIASAIAVCVVVGVASGYIPAVRAAAMDPIEALRHE